MFLFFKNRRIEFVEKIEKGKNRFWAKLIIRIPIILNLTKYQFLNISYFCDNFVSVLNLKFITSLLFWGQKVPKIII